MEKYSVIAEQENCTVVGHYEAQPRQQTAYQSETALEQLAEATGSLQRHCAFG